MLSSMSSLANTMRYQGQIKEAGQLQRVILEKRRSILGEEHQDTLTAISNLTNTLNNQGWMEAAQLHRVVLEKRRRIHGEEQPDTLTAMSNFAHTLRDQGQMKEAE